MKKPTEGYCIYLDAISSDLSLEHIIPKSLGGLDDFSILADKKFNNSTASTIDAGLANDFLMLFDRDRQKAAGHSGTHPEPRVKKATLEDGTPVQVTFAASGLRIYNLRERRYLTDHERSGRTISLEGVTIHLDADLKFVAKVGLAAGFFAYGDLFREQVQHSELRKIVNAEHLNQITPDVRVHCRFPSEQELESETLQILKLATESVECSSVLLMPGKGCFGIAVGVLGNFMGMINVKADIAGFPNTGAYDAGHCIYLQNGRMYRNSLRHVFKKLADHLDSK
jgi:hypothetical protein